MGRTQRIYDGILADRGISPDMRRFLLARAADLTLVTTFGLRHRLRATLFAMTVFMVLTLWAGASMVHAHEQIERHKCGGFDVAVETLQNNFNPDDRRVAIETLRVEMSRAIDTLARAASIGDKNAGVALSLLSERAAR